MNSITFDTDPKPRKFFGKGTIVISLPKSAKITTEIDAGSQRLIVRSAFVYSIRRGPNSTITLKGDADFDALKKSFTPSASVEFKVDKTATMSLSVDKDKTAFKVKITI